MSRRVTLSFDNGPTAGVTEDVLDALAEHDVRATFFVVGRDLERPGARALVERAHGEGHWIGNHTATHTVQLGLEPGIDTARAEIEPTQQLLGDLAHPDRLFRPYGGGGVLGPNVLSPAAVDLLGEGGYTCVLWNSVPHDWEDAEGWVERCLGEVAAQEWSLVVLHDQATGAMPHLRRFLGALADRGVELTQELPPACVPIQRGEVVGELSGLVGEGSGE